MTYSKKKPFYGYGILRSFVIAFKAAFRGDITLQYPREKWELPERARWALAHKFYEDGTPKCTACMACEKACPDYIIKIDVTTDEERNKHIDHYGYEIGACMMCGLCVEACSFDAIEMSHEYELARIDPALLTIDLLTDVDADQPKKRAAAAAAQAPAVVPEPASHETSASPAEGGAS